MNYASTTTIHSKAVPGVQLVVRRMSLGRRIELAKAVRDLSLQMDFHAADERVEGKLESAVISAEVDRLYLSWGLVSVAGLQIDGEPATALTLVDRGPESLTREAIEAIKAECGLSEEQRKN
ncbi:MAG TPA: hypothetical protein DEH78_13385 [Solibacterales bacterium]|nr:hypothetical protein [Bryobacterales bacterium]